MNYYTSFSECSCDLPQGNSIPDSAVGTRGLGKTTHTYTHKCTQGTMPGKHTKTVSN